MDRSDKGLIIEDVVHVRSEVSDDFQRQIAKIVARSLDELARVGFGKGNTQVFTRTGEK